MRKRILIVGTIVLLCGLLAMAALAQNRMQQRGAGQQAAHASAVKTDPVLLAGTVTATNLAAGQGMPSITLGTGAGEITILVGPYRLLMANKFEIRTGQALEVKAFQDPRFPNAYAATEIKDVATGSVVTLRDDAGMPNRGARGIGMMRGGGTMRGGMMRGGQGMPGGRGMHAMQDTATCTHLQAGLNEAAKTVLDGTVVSTNLEPGKGSPTFVLASGGTQATVYACPLHLLLQSGFKISAGDHVSVVAYAIPNEAGSFLAAELSNLTTQKILKLR